jgi:crotonobetainyl-CoA:carnitine CoA-transferase CaiB-like acyl-CoA transferase
VESTTRPDGARMGQPEFYRILHEGNELRTIDFADTAGRAQLRNLLTEAQVVIEASRPRALQALGAAPDDLLYDGAARTWIQITGHGAAEPQRIGYGDDAAVVGGLVGWAEEGPVFVGDAVADPLTGGLAALVALGFLEDRSTTLVQLSLSGVARYCADDMPDRWM